MIKGAAARTLRARLTPSAQNAPQVPGTRHWSERTGCAWQVVDRGRGSTLVWAHTVPSARCDELVRSLAEAVW